jgi:hypothetical protein
MVLLEIFSTAHRSVTFSPEWYRVTVRVLFDIEYFKAKLSPFFDTCGDCETRERLENQAIPGLQDT